MYLEQVLNDINDYLPAYKKQNAKVSETDVAWQLDHSLKVIITVIGQLKKSNPDAYKNRFNLSWVYIRLRGAIPRGVGKAPSVVKAKAPISMMDLENQLTLAKTLLRELEICPANAWFSHPYFGAMNKKNTLKFLMIHSRHHLKIVKDILKGV